MPLTTTYPLRFDCYKCGKESLYPTALKEGDNVETGKKLVKRCTNCGAENTVILPANYQASEIETVFRGSTTD